jgi:nitrogen fixation/metabolism regulation signal transduction histidine kinase
MPHERRVFLLALVAGLPALAIATALLWTGDHADRTRWTLTLLMVAGWLGAAAALREQVVRPLQTLSNLLAALRESDFSLRARGAGVDDALSLAFLEANTLGETLRLQRLGAVEAAGLVRAVISAIDVAVFAFDDAQRLRLVNRAGERLLGRPAEQLLGYAAEELGLARFLEGDVPRIAEERFPGGDGRWEVRRTTFRQEGRPHQLLAIADVTRAVREEELLATRRLVRVLSHEINNSLAPIKSIAGTLQRLAQRTEQPPDWEADLRRGLDVIAARSEALGHFIASYARLTHLPPPRLQPVDVGALVRRVAQLETRLPVRVTGGPEARVQADGEQLEQLLINLVRNAADAALETRGTVEVAWRLAEGAVELEVTDTGPGLADTANLFVPFFTTKLDGSGIGLALSRQIAESHGGTLAVENRRGARGAVARLRLPLGGRRGVEPGGTPGSGSAGAQGPRRP